MQRSIKDLIGCRVVAKDGKAGKVKDVLFGDRRWRVRYLDVDTKTGFHLNLRYLSAIADHDDTKVSRVLIAMEDLEAPKLGLDRRAFPIRLSQQEAKSSPSAVEAAPVETEYDREYRRYFRHGIYDERPGMLTSPGSLGYEPPRSAYEHNESELKDHVERIKEIGQRHLHSAHSVLGYDVIAGDGNSLGTAADLIANTETWAIESLVVDTRHGLPSRKYLVDIAKVTELEWSRSAIRTSLESGELEKLPQFLADAPVNHDAATDRDFDYYGRPCITEFWPAM